jgi:hypothetical protein
MRSTRWLVRGLAAAVAIACVPSTNTTGSKPRGGITVVTVPSPATRGETFVTSDGWTVHVETLVLCANVEAYLNGLLPDGGSFHAADWGDDPLSGDNPPREGEGSAWLFRASDPIEAVIRAVQVGPANVSLGSRCYRYGKYDEAPLVRDLSPPIQARFTRAADGCEDDRPPRSRECYTVGGPALYVSAEGTKDERSLKLDVTLPRGALNRPDLGEPLRLPTVLVQANQLTRMKVGIDAERLFTISSNKLVFDDIARADMDGDGNVTGRELRYTGSPYQRETHTDAGTENEFYFPSMLDELAERVERVFTSAPP